MTGPAEGKLGLNAIVYIGSREKKIQLDSTFVCIHLKGYSLARVTHLDIEHNILDNLIPPKRGSLHEIRGAKGGIEIRLEKEKEIEFQGTRLKPQSILIKCAALNKVLKPAQTTRTWVGGKFGGIYIGFRKSEIARLERLAKEKFNKVPR